MKPLYKRTSGESNADYARRDRVWLNVGGSRFIMSRLTLLRFPRTKLGRLAQSSRVQEYYFDRNPRLMAPILDLYRTGQLHIPRSICTTAIKSELDYWCIPYELISDCCWASFEDGEINRRVIDHIDSAMRDPYEGIKPRGAFRHRIWLTLTNHCYSLKAKLFNVTYIFLLLFTIALFVAESMEDFRYIPNNSNAREVEEKKHVLPGSYEFFHRSIPNTSIRIIDTGCWVFFTIEFIVRLIVCPSRTIFFRSKLNLLDLFLIGTVWLSSLLEMCAYHVKCIGQVLDYTYIFYLHTTMRYMTSFRVLRIFNVIQRNEITHLIMLSLQTTAYSLSLLMIGVILVAILLGSLLYVVEVTAGKFVFKNVGLACWCTFITMMAIGYGDIVPTTAPGYMVAILSAMCGVVLLALPIAIIGTQFNSYIQNLKAQKHRRQRQTCIQASELKFDYRKLSILWSSMTKGNVDEDLNSKQDDSMDQESSIHLLRKPTFQMDELNLDFSTPPIRRRRSF